MSHRPKFITSYFALLALSFLFSGCSSIVRKPEINGVKTVAIVSLAANEMVPWTGGRGRIEGWSLETRQRVATQAYKAYTKEFNRLGWKVLSMDKVVANPEYKKNFGPVVAKADDNFLAKAASTLSKIAASKPFTPPGLYAIEWNPDNRQTASFSLSDFSFKTEKDIPTKLAELAKSLNVDAVVLTYLDYCYTGATAVLGNGTAKMTAGAWVKAVNPDKVVVVDMPAIEKRCDGDRGESDKTVAMIGGSLALGKAFASDTLVTMFQEATAQVATKNVAAIDVAMKK